MPLDFTSRVVRNLELGRNDHLVAFEVPDDVASGMEAGQFFMIGIPGSDVLLRRPFSVCGLPGTFEESVAGIAHVLYRVYGKATTLLASLKAGAELQVLGPLGHGFTRPEKEAVRPLFVAGGIGSAPFPAFATALVRAGHLRPVMVYGARTAAELPLLDWFRRHCEDVVVTTEDGSLGRQGLVTHALADLLDDDAGRWLVYACGPNPMLRAVAAAAGARGVACELSLEAPMACGFGVCLGCVVPCHDDAGGVRFDRVCVEGPVMPAERLAW